MRDTGCDGEPVYIHFRAKKSGSTHVYSTVKRFRTTRSPSAVTRTEAPDSAPESGAVVCHARPLPNAPAAAGTGSGISKWTVP